MRKDLLAKFPMVYIRKMEECKLPKHDLAIKTNTDRILNILSYGIYSMIKNNEVVEKYNKEMDEFLKCVVRSKDRKKLYTYNRNVKDTI